MMTMRRISSSRKLAPFYAVALGITLAFAYVPALTW
jgi:hypothetical protein